MNSMCCRTSILMMLVANSVSVLAWSNARGATRKSSLVPLRSMPTNTNNNHETADIAVTGSSIRSSSSATTGSLRREFVTGHALAGVVVAALWIPTAPAGAVERAVGKYEKDCRDAGDCLEKGDWDGAVGWQWGGKDRCDPADPKCGADGQLMDAPPTGQRVPTVIGKITHEVQLTLSIGKSESGTVRIGLYGQDCPIGVQQLVDFLTYDGIVTSSRLLFEEGYGVSSAPVSMRNGGLLTGIVPGQRLEFGIPSQGVAYAKSKGKVKAGDDFQPQSRPKENALSQEPFLRTHDAAGLLSVPGKGIGYGGSGFEPDDEAFASAFELTGGSVPAMDKEGRRVIGQVLDDESMAFLARLVSLPTRKGLLGILPGQNSGPPLLKVVTREIIVQSKAEEPSSESSTQS